MQITNDNLIERDPDEGMDPTLDVCWDCGYINCQCNK